MRKKDFLIYWGGLPANQPVNPRPIPYDHSGSTYCEDSIRITGRREFVDAVISRLQDLLRYESADTRLQVTYQEVKDTETGQPTGSWSAYIQVRGRGGDALLRNLFAVPPTTQPAPARFDFGTLFGT
jgi:hypothetical protein